VKKRKKIEGTAVLQVCVWRLDGGQMYRGMLKMGECPHCTSLAVC